MATKHGDSIAIALVIIISLSVALVSIASWRISDVIIATGAIVVDSDGATSAANNYVEIELDFPLDSGSTNVNWTSCDATDGSTDAVRRFCQCMGYGDVSLCYYEQRNQRYHWTPLDRPSGDGSCMTQITPETTSGQAITKIQCIPLPVISTTQVSNITQNNASVTWATDVNLTSVVYYSQNETNLNLTAQNTTLVTEHQVLLTNLINSTTYYYKVSSCATNCTNSSIFSFTTLVPPCMGAPILTFEQSTVAYNTQAKAIVTGLSYCGDKLIVLGEGNNCSTGRAITSARSLANGANLTFTAPGITGNYTYVACADINGNNTFESAENSAPAILNVVTCIRQIPDIIVSPREQHASQGETANYEVTVVNKNTCAAIFLLNTTCMPTLPGYNWTCSFSQSSATIGAGQVGKSIFSVTSQRDAPTEVPFTFTVSAQDQANINMLNTTTLTHIPSICIKTNPTITISPSTSEGLPGGDEDYAITVKNTDTCSAIYDIAAVCPAGWNCTLDSASETLLPGSSKDLELEVQLPASAAAGNYSISVTAANRQNPTNYTKTAKISHKILTCTDSDADGFSVEGRACGARDCDDASAVISPDAAEFCGDGVDNNCNNKIDTASEGCNVTIYNQINPTYRVGDGVCNSQAGETYANSPSDCRPSSQEAYCGNDATEIGEECDGDDSLSCPGLCSLSCTCPFIVGDGVCDADIGETAALSLIDCRKKAGGNNLFSVLLALIAALSGGGGYMYYRRRKGLSMLSDAQGVSEPGAGNLEPAVDTMLSQGYGAKEIANQLEGTGWPPNDVNGALAASHDAQTKLGALAEQEGVDVPTKEVKKAENYAKKCMGLGFTPAQIRTALLAANWPAGTVDEVLAKFTEEHVEEHAKKAGILKPTEDADKLRSYIEKELSEGNTPQQIKETLRDAGWDESKLKEVLP